MSPAFVEPRPLPPGFGEALVTGRRGHLPPVSRASEAVALRAVDAAFSRASVRLGQAEAFGRFADPDAIVLAGGDPDFFVGREEIVASRQGGTAVLSWLPKLSDGGPRGDLGWSMGEYTITGPAGAGYGKYLSVWRKNDRGRWKFVQDAGSPNPQPGE